jgi:hypothetical protein
MNLLTRFFPFIAAAFTMTLSSCASNRFYSEVDGRGVIVGRPNIEWVKPDKFIFDRSKNQSFCFHRFNGEVIKPGSIETDGGSIPRLLWIERGYSPWTFAPAYLIHDWLYEAHRRRQPAGMKANGTPLYYDKQQADWIMAEIIKSQMEHPSDYETVKSPGQMKKIYWAVHRFGKTAWNGAAKPVTEPTASPMLMSALSNLPLLPALKALRGGLTPSPDKPVQQGTSSYKP